MQPLTISSPQVAWDPPGGAPQLEKPINVKIGQISYPDGQALAQAEVRKAGAFVYRGAIGAEELWDEKAQQWTAASASADALLPLSPLPFVFSANAAAPWNTVLVAFGQKDNSGNDRFSKAQGGAPRYRLRAFAYAKRNGAEYLGLSAPSGDLLFVSAADQQRFTVILDTGDTSTCQSARRLLKNSALVQAGYLEIRAIGGQEVEIGNCDASGAVQARVLLAANGDIRLEPATGGRIVFTRPLEAEQIRYQPQAGGPKQTL